MATVYTGTNKITSPYGTRIHPITGKKTMHNGQDVVGQTTKQQRFILPSGVVESVNIGYNGGRGNNVVILQSTPRGAVRARYQHNSQVNVRVGQKLSAFDIVGIEGSTGDSTGSHTHIEITVNGKVVDPSPWLRTPNAAGTYPQNDMVYDYGTDKIVSGSDNNTSTEDNDMLYLKVCAPVDTPARSSILFTEDTHKPRCIEVAATGKVYDINAANFSVQVADDLSNVSEAREKCLKEAADISPDAIIIPVEV